MVYRALNLSIEIMNRTSIISVAVSIGMPISFVFWETSVSCTLIEIPFHEIILKKNRFNEIIHELNTVHYIHDPTRFHNILDFYLSHDYISTLIVGLNLIFLRVIDHS